ncbi:hypothetical protein M8J77_021359 [Diaphorina citri]|nr:hypothetical protein M8J77_021359 [Diaphorina citri]
MMSHADSEDLVSSLLEMYDALICTTNTNPELVNLPNLGTKIDFSPSLKRKSIQVPKIKTDVKRSSTNLNLERKRPPDPPPAPPVVARPLSVSSMASLSSTSSSSVSSCGHIARIRRTGVVHNSAYLASIESLESSSTLDETPGRGNGQLRRQRSKCGTLSSTGERLDHYTTEAGLLHSEVRLPAQRQPVLTSCHAGLGLRRRNQRQ